MSSAKHEMTQADIIGNDVYGPMRAERRRQIAALKRNRRVEVGPIATFYFENYDTMWHQIHEMLYIEKGGDAQIEDELRAYNPLIPKGHDLVATLMFEIDDPVRRKNVLASLGGIDHAVTLMVGADTIRGQSVSEVERTNEAGKASAVHFIRFTLTDAQIATFRRPRAQIVLGFAHPNYGHMAVIPESVRAALAEDLD
ncbi:MAG: DUF3501 family protein [Alphaproteobacteria bacterium]|mgnify:CR=1 FL=1